MRLVPPCLFRFLFAYEFEVGVSEREPPGRDVTSVPFSFFSCWNFFFFWIFKKKKTLFLSSLCGASAQAAFTLLHTDVAIITTQIVLSYIYCCLSKKTDGYFSANLFSRFGKVAVGVVCCCCCCLLFVVVVEEESFAIKSVRRLLHVVVSENLRKN